MRKITVFMALTIAFCVFAPAPSQALKIRNPFRHKYDRSGEENAQLIIKNLKKSNPEFETIFKESAGWAVFPRIGKAGIGIGGASGNGRVYRKGEFIGTTSMLQASFGFQLGGQTYSEIIFFQNEAALEKFRGGKFELGANVSAIIINEGVAKEIGFKDGVIVVIIPQKGLMYEATISGQHFTFDEKRNKADTR